MVPFPKKLVEVDSANWADWEKPPQLWHQGPGLPSSCGEMGFPAKQSLLSACACARKRQPGFPKKAAFNVSAQQITPCSNSPGSRGANVQGGRIWQAQLHSEPTPEFRTWPRSQAWGRGRRVSNTKQSKLMCAPKLLSCIGPCAKNKAAEPPWQRHYPESQPRERRPCRPSCWWLHTDTFSFSLPFLPSFLQLFFPFCFSFFPFYSIWPTFEGQDCLPVSLF